MSDLIDLKSPDGKTVGPKLASPLIPAPTKSLNDEKSEFTKSQTSSGLNFVKRTSLDNNPFDNALHKTAEYTRKQDDPFEVALEKALTYDDNNISVNTSKYSDINFKDNITTNKIRYSDILKMNKALDDSIVSSNTRSIVSSPCPGDDSIIHNLDDTNLLTDNCDNNDDNPAIGKNLRPINSLCIPKINIDRLNADSSILNQSAMNDSLTESSDSSEEFLIKSMVAQRISMCIKKGTDDANKLLVDDNTKSHKLRRSFSQGDKLCPKKFKQQRSQSIVDSLKASMSNDNEGSICNSIIFEDPMNKAFMQTLGNRNVSTVSSLSEISGITRINSVSSVCNLSNSSSVFSNRTANCAFIESSVAGVDGLKGVNDMINGRRGSLNRIYSTGSIATIIKSPQRNLRNNDDITDLISKYSRLKAKSIDATLEVSATRLPSIISGSGIFNESENSDNKLIDLDLFVPSEEGSSPLEQSQRQSISNISSDSVFLDNNTVGKSILSEAKSLAKTFEELAGKTSCSSGSSVSDDLINSRPPCNFDQLPVSDEEALVDNLIELPISPVKDDSSKIQNTDETKKENNSSTISEPKSEKSMLRELERVFIDPEKKIYASMLMMDLEKLVKSECNPEAVKLLKNLEKALGVKCDSNSELLASCFSEKKNDLTKSPKRSESALGMENIINESIEKSCEDNVDVESSLSQPDKSLRNNLNTHKEINKSDKSLVLVSEGYENLSPKKLQSENSPELIHDDSIEALKKQSQIDDDQKMAMELLIGLGKLLSGDNKDPAMVKLMKNLGMAMNLANDASDNIVKESKRPETPIKKRVATPPRKPTTPFAFSRSSYSRKSLESNIKSKATAERVMRKSISVIHTPDSTTTRISNMPILLNKSKTIVIEGKKRFSSDPGLTQTAFEKKRDIQLAQNRKSSKDVSLKSVGVSELARQEKPSSTTVDSVKTKLRKKTDSDGASKRGPMKALIPLGNMQRQGSVGKRISPFSGSVTPPKPGREPPSAFTVTTSTPFPVVHIACPKKSPKQKPIASSTPDAGGPRNLRRSEPIFSSPAKNNISCNISPVTSKTDEDNIDNSPKNNSKSLKASKICTPSKSRSGSQLPKFSPMLGPKSSPNNSSRFQRRSDPVQSFLPRSLNPLKSPSIRVTEGPTSPLNNSNKVGSKIKPLHLISKLRRRSGSVAEKENYA